MITIKIEYMKIKTNDNKIVIDNNNSPDKFVNYVLKD